MKKTKITILKPIGYCLGVLKAVKLVKELRKKYKDNPIIILGMLVHNKEVIEELSKLKIINLEASSISEKISIIKNAPNNTIFVFSAHGHELILEEEIKKRGLKYFDATCEKVQQNLKMIKDEIKNDNEVIYIGVYNHPECNAALSISEKVLFYNTKQPFNYYKITRKSPLVINQTTLNTLKLKEVHNEIKKHIPLAKISNEVCDITRLRQENIIKLENDVDLLLIIGDKKSSNANKLYEIAKENHPLLETVFILNKNDLNIDIFLHKKHIAIASSASTPIETVNDVYQFVLDKIN